MRRAVLAESLLLAACSGDPVPAPVPTPTVSVTPAPLPPSRPLRPGELPSPELDAATPLEGAWRFRASASGSATRYEVAGAAAFAIRCDPQARRIVFVHSGAGNAIRLVVADAAATFPAQRIDGMLEAAVTTGQTFLDALARADTIGVGSDGDMVRRLPGDPSIGDVVRSCRPAG